MSNLLETTRDSSPLATELAVDVSEREFARLLGYSPGVLPHGKAAVLANAARAWFARQGRPWFHVRLVKIARIQLDAIVLETGDRLCSTLLAGQLKEAEAHALVIMAVSAGVEIDAEAAKLWTDDRPDEAFALDRFASAVAEHLTRSVGIELCAWAKPQGIAVLPHYSPGYPGWNLSDQQNLFQILNSDPRHSLPGEMQVLASGMITPRHSLLGAFGLTHRQDFMKGKIAEHSCGRCTFSPCGYRRVPFQSETTSPASSQTQYGFPEKALRRWATEHLTLDNEPGGSLRAQFHFIGSTCSSGGVPLEFLFDVRLGPKSLEYPVLSASCQPCRNDEGHRAMCAFGASPDRFLSEIESWNELTGCSLSEVLSWAPDINPAACLCMPGNRNHKWKMVMQTVHYALMAGLSPTQGVSQ